jgi:hypothetical protein
LWPKSFVTKKYFGYLLVTKLIVLLGFWQPNTSFRELARLPIRIIPSIVLLQRVFMKILEVFGLRVGIIFEKLSYSNLI